MQPYRGRRLQGLKRLDRRHQFHPVVGGRGFASADLLGMRSELEHRPPAAGTGVAAARTVGIDLHRGTLSVHGDPASGASRSASGPSMAGLACNGSPMTTRSAPASRYCAVVSAIASRSDTESPSSRTLTE